MVTGKGPCRRCGGKRVVTVKGKPVPCPRCMGDGSGRLQTK